MNKQVPTVMESLAEKQYTSDWKYTASSTHNCNIGSRELPMNFLFSQSAVYVATFIHGLKTRVLS
jgi:hypothetical protein